jgi:hypothetical protein
MPCCNRKKLTREQKAERKFDDYIKSLVTGTVVAIAQLGLSSATVANSRVNGPMIWHVCLVRPSGTLLMHVVWP